MKFESNWKQKTLENLEKDNWGDPPIDDSHLVRRTMALRRVPVCQFTTEDLRIMIGQEIGLYFLLPLAFETLNQDLYAEGDYYPGDLLNMTLSIKHSFWFQNQNYWRQLNDLIKDRIQELKQYRPKLSVDFFYSSTY